MFLLAFLTSQSLQAQNPDSLNRKLLELEGAIQEIDLRLNQSQRKFQSGILVSTIGYTVTIAGGLMLGRENDELGQLLLVTGGLTGGIGTYIMVDAFRGLGGRRKKRK